MQSKYEQLKAENALPKGEIRFMHITMEYVHTKPNHLVQQDN